MSKTVYPIFRYDVYIVELKQYLYNDNNDVG